jgi:hypothetical protein
VQVKRGVGARQATPDPEAALPGPSKVVLEAALRALASMAMRSPSRAMGWLVGQHSERSLMPLVLLLGHHSGRVQLRAAQVGRGVLVGPPP